VRGAFPGILRRGLQLRRSAEYRRQNPVGVITIYDGSRPQGNTTSDATFSSRPLEQSPVSSVFRSHHYWICYEATTTGHGLMKCSSTPPRESHMSPSL
jgi:hypothetical protein